MVPTSLVPSQASCPPVPVGMQGCSAAWSIPVAAVGCSRQLFPGHCNALLVRTHFEEMENPIICSFFSQCEASEHSAASKCGPAACSSTLPPLPRGSPDQYGWASPSHPLTHARAQGYSSPTVPSAAVECKGWVCREAEYGLIPHFHRELRMHCSQQSLASLGLGRC